MAMGALFVSCIEDADRILLQTDVNITNYGPESPSVGSLYEVVDGYEAEMATFRQAGNMQAVDSLLQLRTRLFGEIREIARQELRETLDTIPYLGYQLTDASGMYLGRQEPSLVVTLEAEASLRDRAVSALTAYARFHGQQTIIVSERLGAVQEQLYGNANDGYTIEPTVIYRTTPSQNIDTLADRFLIYHFVGFTAIPIADAHNIELYYIPDFELDAQGNGRSRAGFLADAQMLTQAGAQNGWFSHSEIAARKLRVIWTD